MAMERNRQRIEIAIRCVLSVYNEPTFVEWANRWLDGKDRSPKAAARAACDIATDNAIANTATLDAAAPYAAAWAAIAAFAAAHVIHYTAKGMGLFFDEEREYTMYADKAAEYAICAADEAGYGSVVERVCDESGYYIG